MTSLHILLGNGMPAAPLVEADPDAICRKWDSEKPGAGALPAVSRSRGFGSIDVARAASLLEASFGKRLSPGYFCKRPERVYVAGDFEGIAVVRDIGAGVPYLDKLAVSPESQGTGVGRKLWENIKNDYQSLIWRASPGNPANGWYDRNSDGSVHAGGWIVYWYGVEASRADSLVPLVARLPATLIANDNR